LEKRATVIDSIRSVEKNLILIDTGDILSSGINPRRHKFIAKTYQYLKYDIWTPGDQDFVEGKNLFFYSLLPVFKNTLNTNLLVEGSLFGDPYVIKKFKGINIGFTSTITKEVEDYISPIRELEVSIENQDKTLMPVINQLKEKSDIIILLSHSGYDKDIEFAKTFDEIDLIIGGHSQTLLKEAALISETYIVQAGKAGYRIGVLKLKIENSKISHVENKLILLDKKVKNHPDIMKIIDDYKNKVKY
jgi:2',3'-cyclic-nucleotide 2'-phosphodiesterase (5'-nucleotidase family)